MDRREEDRMNKVRRRNERYERKTESETVGDKKVLLCANPLVNPFVSLCL